MPPKKKNQKKNELLDEAANSTLEDEVGEGSIDMASLQNVLEALFDRRFNLQSNHLNELFIKHSQTTKADLDAIKESQKFLGLKFDELVASLNEVKTENGELRKINQQLQQRVQVL